MSAVRTVVAAAVIAVAIAAGVLLWQRADAIEPAAVASTTAVSTAEPAQAASPDSSVPPATATLTHVAESPEQAAVRFLELTEVVVGLPPAEAAEVQRSVASAASAELLASSVLETMTDLQSEFPEGVDVEIAPLGVSSMPAGDAWLVEVWYAAVATYGEIVAVERWETATYRVVFEEGEWRMDDLVTVEGPTPVRPESLVATPTDLFISSTARFSDEVITP